MAQIGITVEALYDGDQAKKGLKGLSSDLKKVSGISRIIVKPEIDLADPLKGQKQAIKDYYSAIEKEMVRGVNFVNAKGEKVRLKAFQFLDGKGSIKDIVNTNDLKKAVESFSKLNGDRAAMMQNLYAGLYNRMVDFGQSRIDQRRFEAKQRTRQQNRKLDSENEEISAAKQLLSIEKQITKERTKHARGGGEWLSSIYRQINLYHDLEDAARKANNAKYADFIRDKRLPALNQQADALERVNRLFGKQGRVVNGLRSVLYRYFSVYMVADFAKKVAETTGYFQQQRVALEGILGSASKAVSVLNEIKSFALQSPFQTKDLVTFTKQLAAFGVNNNDLFPTVKKLADISAGLGVDMGRIILAYGQVKSAAVLRGQELRQFTEAGIPMVQALADKFTALNGKLVTTGEVFKLISERKVPFEMVASVLSDMTAEGGKFYKMQENITNTTYGQIQKLKDIWTITLDAIGKESESFINSIIKGLQNIVKNIQPIATAVTAIVIGRGFGKLVETGYRVIRMFKLMKTAALGAKGIISSIGGILGLAGGAIVGFVLNAKRRNHELEKSMQEVADSYDKDTRRMVDGIDGLVKKLSTASVGTKKFNDAVSALISNYGQFLSSDITEALTKQGDEAGRAATRFLEMADAIKEAIRQQQEYYKLKEKGDTAAAKAAENGKERTSAKFVDDILNSTRIVQGERSAYSVVEELAGVTEFLKKNEGLTHETLKEAIIGILGDAVEDAAKQGLKSDDMDAIKEHLAKSLMSIYDLDEETTRNIVSNFVIRGFDKKAYDAAAQNYAAAESTIYGKLLKPFNDLDRTLTSGEFMEGQHAIDKEQAKTELAFNAMAEALKHIPGYDTEKVLTRDGIDYTLKDLVESQKHDTDAAYELVQAFRAFENGKGETIVSYLNILSSRFQQYAEVRSGTAANIAEAFRNENSKVYNWRNNENLKEIVATYGSPTNANYMELREKLAGAYSKKVQDIDRLERVPNRTPEWNKELAKWKEERDAMKILMGGEYYANSEKKTGGGGRNKYARIRIVNFFDDVLQMITKAEDAAKKVAGVTGWTDSMTDFFAALSDDNYMKEFFKKGGKPFEKFFEKLGEYGVTEFLPQGFDAQNIEALFKNAGWEEGKPFEAPDFERMYRSVIEGVAKEVRTNLDNRMKNYAVGTSEYNSLESAKKSLDEFITRSEKNADMRWKGDEVQKKIDAAIKELRDINTNVEDIKNKRKAFESIAGASNYIEAQRIVYGGGQYKRLDNVDLEHARLKSILGSDAGKGIASTHTGTALGDILKAESVNINSLGALLAIQARLQKQMGSQKVLDENGNPTNEEVSDNFKESTQFVSEGVKALADALLEEYKQLKDLDSDVTKKGNKFIAAGRKYADSLDLINKAVENGLLKDPEATEKRITAIQEYFESITSAIPDWIKHKYGEDNGSTGISKKGQFMLDFFGMRSFEDHLKAMIAEEYKKKEDNLRASAKARKEDLTNQYNSGNLSREEYDNAMKSVDNDLSQSIEKNKKSMAQEMSIASDRMQQIDKIFKYIYAAIKGIVDMAEHTMQAAEATSNKLNAKKGKDGIWRVSDDYYADRDRRETSRQALELVGTYNQHVMDGWEAFKNQDYITMIVEIYNSIADLVRDISNILNVEDRQKQDALIRSNEDLEKALNKLEHTLQDEAGIERWRVMSTEIANLRTQQMNYQSLLDIENNKKSGDDEKLKSYADAIDDAQMQIEDMIRSIREEIFSTADDVAKQLTDPLVDAFRNGENAARSWRDAVRGYIGDVLKEALMTKVVAPKINDLIKSYFGKSEKPEDIIARLSDPYRATGFRNDMFLLGDEMIDWFNNLAEPIQEMIAWNSESSVLSGGIQGITEDTARTLEGLSNSMLAQLVLIQRSVLAIENSGFANVQTSWFNDMLNQQKAMRLAVDSIEGILTGARDGVRSLQVRME